MKEKEVDINRWYPNMKNHTPKIGNILTCKRVGRYIHTCVGVRIFPIRAKFIQTYQYIYIYIFFYIMLMR